jgi:hypothetical protein
MALMLHRVRDTMSACVSAYGDKPGHDQVESHRLMPWYHTAAIASISKRKFGLASPRKMHSVLAGG